MNTVAPLTPLERFLSRLLHYGTSAASAVIALGLAVAFVSSSLGLRIATAGIVIFIALPVVRVGAMLVAFLRAKDYRFSAVAALVLAIIACSYLIGAG